MLVKKSKCSKSISGFSISRLANADDFFNVNIFFRCKYVRITDYFFKYVCVLLLKNSFLLLHFFCNVEFEFSWFRNTKHSSEFLIVKIKMLLEFQNKATIEIIRFYLMHFEFALQLSDIDLWNIGLLDTRLDFLDTDISSKYFVCLHNTFKTSSRHVFEASRYVFKTFLR